MALTLGPPSPSAKAAADGAVNACGCGRDTTGSCFCQKAARCGCPGECEPKGCEDKRVKQLEKEIEAETKRAADEDRKRNAPRPMVQPADSDDADQEAPKTKTTARADVAPPSAARASRSSDAKKMTASQKKKLALLLEAYLAENPDRRSRTVAQVRDDLE